MHRYIIAAVASLLLMAAGPTRPTYDGITRGYSGRTVDLTALTSAGKSIGDGTTDASPAFTAAVALTGNATVTIPCGTYLLSATKAFSITTNLSFVGVDRNCVTIKFPAATVLTSGVFNFITSSALKSTFSGITIDFANATVAGPTPIGMVGTNQHRLDVVDSAFINGSAYMFLISEVGQTNGFTVSRNVFSMTDLSFTQDGIGCLLITTSAGVLSRNGRVTNNQATNCSFSVTGHDILFDANTFFAWGAAGGGIVAAASVATYNLTITNNIFDGTGVTGAGTCLEIWAKNSVIANNQMHDCPGSGIDIGGQNSIVSGNQIWGVGAGSTSSAAITTRYLDATYNVGGTYFTGNHTYDGGAGFQKYGFADQRDNGGVLGCNGSRLCSGILGNNSFSGTLGPVQIRSSGDVYALGGKVVDGGTTGGSADAQTIAAVTTPVIITSTFVAGLTINFIPGFTNTGAATLNVKTGIANATTDDYSIATKSTGAIAIKKKSGASLVDVAANDIVTAIPATVVYDGTVWVLQ